MHLIYNYLKNNSYFSTGIGMIFYLLNRQAFAEGVTLEDHPDASKGIF
jgi:hypothetical protein